MNSHQQIGVNYFSILFLFWVIHRLRQQQFHQSVAFLMIKLFCLYIAILVPVFHSESRTILAFIFSLECAWLLVLVVNLSY